MYALLQVVIKEFLQLRHDRKMIPVLIVGPVVQLLALGFAANMDVNQIPLLLVDQDRTRGKPRAGRALHRFGLLPPRGRRGRRRRRSSRG